MERNEIDDEDVASPGRHHVEIGDGSCCGPHDRACLHRLDPQEIREEKSKYRDSFIVVGAGNGARDVARDDGNKTGCQKTGTSVPDLPCEKKTSNGCQPTEQRQRERERDERERKMRKGWGAQTDLNMGARKTQMSRMWTGKWRELRSQWMVPEVTMRPGYTVPPTILPRGYHARSSNQFRKL